MTKTETAGVALSFDASLYDHIVAENTKVGEDFLMKFPVPPLPELQEASEGQEWIIGEASYEGLWSHDKVEELVNSQRLKVMYYDPHLEQHHIVGFSGFRWVNDAIALSFIDQKTSKVVWNDTVEA